MKRRFFIDTKILILHLLANETENLFHNRILKNILRDHKGKKDGRRKMKKYVTHERNFILKAREREENFRQICVNTVAETRRLRGRAGAGVEKTNDTEKNRGWKRARGPEERNVENARDI